MEDFEDEDATSEVTWWYDPESGTVTSGVSTRDTDVKIIGDLSKIVAGLDEEEIREIVGEIFESQEDAYDVELNRARHAYEPGVYYGDENCGTIGQNRGFQSPIVGGIISPFRSKSRSPIVENFLAQIKLGKNYSDFLNKKYPGLKISPKNVQFVARRYWLTISTFEECDFDILVMVNNERQGLFHSFLRHRQEWIVRVPVLAKLNDRFRELLNDAEIQSFFDQIAKDPRFNDKNLDRFGNFCLSNDRTPDFRKLLIRIQDIIYKYLCDKMSHYRNYQCNALKDEKDNQMIFDDEYSKSSKLVVAISRELFFGYSPNYEFKPPKRLIITAYFADSRFIQHDFVGKLY